MPTAAPDSASTELDDASLRKLREQLSTNAISLTHKGLSALPTVLADHLGERGRRLWTLDLEGNRLGSAPFIGQVTNLTALNLASNHLTSLDTSIGKLVNLQSLVVENNHLTALPDSLCQCEALTCLHAANNKLTALPAALSRLACLQSLQLHSNQLSHIPLGVCALFDLEELTLGHNQLTAVPMEICQLKRLTSLSLRFNRLSALPPSLGSMQRALTELLLNDNQLSILPRELAQLRLRKLTTGCNPLVVPPLQVCAKGTSAVREYLQSMGELQVESALQGAGGDRETRTRRSSGGSAGADDVGEPQACHECVTLQQQVDQLREQVSVLERSRQLSELEAARAKEHTVRKDKQLMDLQSKTREQEARWAELEKRLHRRSVQTAQEGQHLAAEAQNARASHETAAQQAAARLAAADMRLTGAERIIAQLRAQLQGAEEEKARAATLANTRAEAQSTECTQLRARLAEVQGQSDRYRERAREAEASVSLPPSSSEWRGQFSSTAATKELQVTVDRERQAANEREKRLLEQVASLQLKLERASTTEPQAAPCVECFASGRDGPATETQPSDVQCTRERPAPPEVPGGGEGSQGRAHLAGALDRDRARRLSGSGDTADWQMRRGPRRSAHQAE